MPKYTFKCDECKNSFEFRLGMNDEKPEKCECGGKLNRDFSKLNIDSSSSRNDPNSHNYWQKGKSADEIASAISGESSPY